ncbi:Lar family restriction alleviation protein [Burkholderia multivorans]|uniref:Lar family restriction alleviation protein n=1 Tax=Burkholderia multivorans TaxID=87883 RepID=UPI001C216DFC|nr:Lar family restriction alleviation protein [Burkholderia multivorans]MBU9581335.1 Lar family restriction alleviation protein [Burkholderia multivorans]
MTTDKSRADALTDLLPCPFCGREAEAEKIEDACYGVGCQSCDFQLMSGNVGIGWFASEAEAISAWNRRVDASPVQQRAAAPNEDHECVYENGDGICRECVELAKVGRIAPAPADERAAFEALRYIDAQLTEYLEGMPADETSRKLRDVARNALAGSARASSANETDDYETRRQVAEALGIVWPGTVDGKRIGFAWSYLLGCIKDLSSDVRHIYGAYGDACARASANETGAPIGWAWISPTGHVSRFTADFDGKHDELVQGWKVRPVAFCDSVANETGAEGAEEAKPTAWVRFRSDGGFEGPIMDTDERMCDTRRKSGAWTPLFLGPAQESRPLSIPAGWMLIPKHRGTKPLAELIIAASLACVENRLMDDDDRHELAQFADQLQHALKTAPAQAAEQVAQEVPLTMALNPNAPPLTMTLGPAQAAEPVAWYVTWPGDPKETWCSVFVNERDAIQSASNHEGAEIKPLYAAPQPPALADAREGLTDERIAHIGAAHTNSVVNSTVF